MVITVYNYHICLYPQKVVYSYYTLGALGQTPLEEIRALSCVSISQRTAAHLSDPLLSRFLRRRSLFPLTLCYTFYRSRSRHRLSPLRQGEKAL